MRSKLLMYLSLIILAVGLVGIYMTKTSLSQPPVDNTPVAPVVKAVPPEVYFSVWTAKQDLAKGSIISRDDLRIKQVTQQEGFENGIKKDIVLEFDDGMVVKKAIAKDGLVFPEDLVSPDERDYFSFAIEDGFLPVPVSVSATAVLGDVIKAGSLVDVLALLSTAQNLNGSAPARDLGSVSLKTVVNGAKVLQVIKNVPSTAAKSSGMLSLVQPSTGPQMVSLILQLTKAQAAKVTMASSIAKLEVLLSSDKNRNAQINIDAGDIVPQYRAVIELRPNSSGSQQSTPSITNPLLQ